MMTDLLALEKRNSFFIRFVLILLVGLLPWNHKIYAQCDVQGPFPIEDLSNEYYPLEITGALNDSLSSPDQGICGIVLNFTHDAVADLFIQLYSPSGQLVNLIGPVSNTPPHTDFSSWNILFVPCGVPASPDPGFSAQWSNNQPWGVFGNYTGSYHPFEGCLEDFNEGPVNGTWTLFVQDGLQFFDGELIGFSLVFCDPSGIDCVSCEPDGGLLPFFEFEFCQGDTIFQLPNPVYPGSEPPDEDEYDFVYLFVNNNNIQHIFADSFLSLDFSGEYRIYGLSILRQDSAVLETLGEDYTYSQLSQALSQNFKPFCGDLSMSFIDVWVHPSFDSLLEVTICTGDSLQFANSSFFEEGIYRFEHQTEFGCDSIFELHLSFSNLEAVLQGDSFINCHDTIAVLTAENSIFPTNYTLHWWTFDGEISGQTDSTIVEALAGGTYYFELADGECRDTATFFVTGSPFGPELAVYATEINCGSDSAIISVETMADLIEINWSGPGVSESAQSSIVVFEPGWYYIEAVDADSCVRLDSVLVFEDFTEPTFEFDTIFGNCIGDVFLLQHPEMDSLWEFVWYFDGDTLTGSPPAVNEPGYYRAEIIGSNGCTGVDSVFVDFLFRTPTVTIASAPLDCNEAEILVVASTGFGGSTYFWQGPNGFEAFVQQFFAPFPGQYNLEVTSPQGCVLDTFFVVESLGNLPEVDIFLSDDSGCIGDSIQIILETNFSNVQVQWSGPDGFISDEPSPFVNQHGWYFLEIVTLGSCIVNDSIFITDAVPVDQFEILADTLNCEITTGLISVSGPSGWNFLWNGPGLIDVEGDSATIITGGDFELTVIDPSSGCSARLAVFVGQDTVSPQASFMVGDTISCLNDRVMVELSIAADSEFFVSGSGLVEVEESSFTADRGGTYELTVVGQNGCSSVFPIFIYSDTSIVDVEPMIPFFGCGRDSVLLTVSDPDRLVGIQWTGPAGFQSTEFEVLIYEPGDYSVHLIGINGCDHRVDFEVEEDLSTPDVIFSEYGEINCDQATVDISILNVLPGFQYSWNFPDGRLVVGSEILADVSGWYFVETTDDDGCTGLDSLFVREDISIPEVEIEWGVINCLNPSTLLIAHAQNVAEFSWTGPNGFNSQDSIVEVFESGFYELTVTGFNGCDTLLLVEVLSDTITPTLIIEGETVIDCNSQMAELAATSDFDDAEFEWIFPDSTVVGTAEISTNLEGVYIAMATLPNGCFVKDSLMVVVDTIQPEVNFEVVDIDCAQIEGAITITPVQNVASVVWHDEIAEENELAAIVQNGGIYLVEIIGDNGCSFFLEIEVEENIEGPTFELLIGELNCDELTRELSFNSDDSVEIIQWFGEGGFLTDERVLIVSEEGEYTLRIIDSHGCVAEEIVQIDLDVETPEYRLSVEMIDCNNDEALVSLEIESHVEFRFIGPDGFVMEDSVFFTSLTGDFQLEVFSPSTGCSSVEGFSIFADTSSPNFSIQILSPLGCDGSPGELFVDLVEELNNPGFSWTGPSGGITGPNDLRNVIVEEGGAYTAVVHNFDNGCKASSEILVEVHGQFGPVIIDLEQPDCDGNDFGSLRVLNITGATDPIEIRFSQEDAIIENEVIFGIEPGIHILTILDANECSWDTTLMVVESHFEVDLGPDLMVEPGTIVEIYAEVIPPGDNYLFFWQPDQGCTDCDELSMVISDEIYLELLVLDSVSGCEARDRLHIQLLSTPRVFVPNVFYPGSNTGNETFRAHWNQFVEGMSFMKIFDRNGNMVFSHDGCQRLECSWDGKVNGQLAEPGVYLYLMEFKTLDGGVIIEKGDVLLLR
ncbi:MAG: hypothetical protein EA409_01440 [Saprospirales bacterium]|nr:MAG: hypothetical protein EA409_01440 [Saprospirales bacterium]